MVTTISFINEKPFRDAYVSMIFDKRTTELLIEVGELLDWSEINLDILGSRISNVANDE